MKVTIVERVVAGKPVPYARVEVDPTLTVEHPATARELHKYGPKPLVAKRAPDEERARASAPPPAPSAPTPQAQETPPAEAPGRLAAFLGGAVKKPKPR